MTKKLITIISIISIVIILLLLAYHTMKTEVYLKTHCNQLERKIAENTKKIRCLENTRKKAETSVMTVTYHSEDNIEDVRDEVTESQTTENVPVLANKVKKIGVVRCQVPPQPSYQQPQVEIQPSPQPAKYNVVHGDFSTVSVNDDSDTSRDDFETEVKVTSDVDTSEFVKILEDLSDHYVRN